LILIAGAWLGPLLAVSVLWGLGHRGDAGLPLPLIGMVVAASLLAGAPAALIAGREGAVTGPLGLATALGFAFGAGACWFAVAEDAGLALASGLAASGLAALWIAGGVAAYRPVRSWPALIAALIGLVALGWLFPGPAGALVAVGAAAAMAGLGGVAHLAFSPQRARGAVRPALLGLALALAVLAGPMVQGMAPILALIVALPGFGVLLATRDMAPLRLGIALLMIQALATFLALAMQGAVVALGLLPAEALEAFRWALLGAGFLPVFCALAAGAMARGDGAAMMVLGTYAVLSAVAPLLLGPIGLLLAPLGAIMLAAPLSTRGVDDAARA